MKMTKYFAENKIKLLGKRTKIAITLFLALSIVFTMFAVLSPVKAQDRIVEGFLSVSPNPVGIGEPCLVLGWMQTLPPSGQVFTSFKVTISDPDNVVSYLGPGPNSSYLGTTIWYFTPTKVGEYTMQMEFPGQTFPAGQHYLPVTTQKVKLTVIDQPLANWPETPLPTGYWTRPIQADNWEWWSISGNWLKAGRDASNNRYNPQSTLAPPHIMWTRELQFGGIAGGADLEGGYGFGANSYQTGQAYEGKWSNPMILFGRLYYTVPIADRQDANGTICVDLRTGEKLWQTPVLFSEAQIFHYESINQGGLHAFLWVTAGAGGAGQGLQGAATWQMYDAYTGEWILNFTGVTAGSPQFTTRIDNYGSLCAYFVSGSTGQVVMWNSTKALDENGQITYQNTRARAELGIYGGQFRPVHGNYNWSRGIEFNVTNTPPLLTAQPYVSEKDGVWVARGGSVARVNQWMGFSLTTGKMLWNISANPPYDYSASAIGIGSGLLMDCDVGLPGWIAYDLKTGNVAWKTGQIDYPWGSYGGKAYGVMDKIFITSYGGTMFVYDKNGTQLWKFNPGPTDPKDLMATPSWLGSIAGFADGKVLYRTMMTWDHGVLEHGHKMYCLDAQTGELLWSIDGRYSPAAIADGYLVAHNLYDNRIYCFGLGPSATEVSAPENYQPLGIPILIKGSVTDQTLSGITKDTPAVSDASMGNWMEYLYMGKQCPTNATGVTVKLEAIDPNGNYINIGTTTSDVSGTFSYEFNPDKTGKYTIIATFEGTGSYASSYAETYVGIYEQAVTPTATPITMPPFEMYTVGIGIAIIIAIALAVLLLRRRP